MAARTVCGSQASSLTNWLIDAPSGRCRRPINMLFLDDRTLVIGSGRVAAGKSSFVVSSGVSLAADADAVSGSFPGRVT